MKLKKGDQIKVMLGKDRGKLGKVEAVFPQDNSVVVTGVNMYKKHVKKQGQDKPGGIIDLTKPLNVAKVALICPQCHLITRIGFSGVGPKKVRICKKCRKPL
ncbi:MAG: 50S ribosomal protein L24 [Patescibacteria group bacterium]